MSELVDRAAEAVGAVVNHPIVQAALQLIVAYAVIIWLASAYWASQDIRRRTPLAVAPYLVAGAVILASPLFFVLVLAVYRIVRPGETMTEAAERRLSELAIAQELVADARDGWRWLLDRLTAGDAALAPLRTLGRRTAELHLALAADPGEPAFAPERITAADIATWTEAVQRQLDAARAALGGRWPAGGPARIDAAGLAGLVGAAKLRHHGDFHLGQTLAVGDGADFAIIDFEGEPLRPLAERRRKHTPLRDVAGLLRSLGYAAASAPARPGWEAAARDAFVAAYREAAGAAPFLPAGDAAFTRALAVLEVEKAAYEIVYEANNRPDWVAIPVRGLVSATEALRSGRAAGAA